MEAILRKTNNILLARDDLGKSRPPPYQLPNQGFTYGKSGDHDAEGAREGTFNNLT